MQDLIQEYRETIKMLEGIIRNYETEPMRDYSGDIQQIKSMISDLQWSLVWMKTGRRPGNRRGIERLAAYQKERPIDPIHFQNYVQKTSTQPEKSNLSDWDLVRIEDALSVLTPLEREVYTMSRGYCLPFSEIAGMMGVAKGTVQKMIERAENKMQIYKKTCLHNVM